LYYTADNKIESEIPYKNDERDGLSSFKDLKEVYYILHDMITAMLQDILIPDRTGKWFGNSCSPWQPSIKFIFPEWKTFTTMPIH
jgi:hypothetical protein